MVGGLIADRYELEELVGTGGMSSVYRAQNPSMSTASESRPPVRVIPTFFHIADRRLDRTSSRSNSPVLDGLTSLTTGTGAGLRFASSPSAAPRRPPERRSAAAPPVSSGPHPEG